MRDVAGRCRTAQWSDVSRTLHTRDGKIHRGVGRVVDWQASDGVFPILRVQGLNTTENFGSDGVDVVDENEKDGWGWRLEAHSKIPLPQDNPGRKSFPRRHGSFGEVLVASGLVYKSESETADCNPVKVSC